MIMLPLNAGDLSANSNGVGAVDKAVANARDTEAMVSEQPVEDWSMALVSGNGSGNGRAPAPAPDVTVIFLVKDPGPHELETPALIRKQTYPGTTVIQVIDSSSDPEQPSSRAVRDSADRWHTIPPEDFGHGRTRNLGVELAATPIVVFLSSDAHPISERWLEALVTPLIEGRAEASYGRQQSPVPSEERRVTFGFLYPDEPEIKTKDRIPELGIRTFHFSDVTSAFLTEVIRKVGFPDVPMSEDVGVAKRILDEGGRIAYVPEATVLHVHVWDSKAMWRRYRQIGAVYERLGIFADIEASVGKAGLVGEGLRVTRRITPHGRNLRETADAVRIAVIKAAAVAWGRRAERRNPGHGELPG